MEKVIFKVDEFIFGVLLGFFLSLIVTFMFYMTLLDINKCESLGGIYHSGICVKSEDYIELR